MSKTRPIAAACLAAAVTMAMLSTAPVHAAAPTSTVSATTDTATHDRIAIRTPSAEMLSGSAAAKVTPLADKATAADTQTLAAVAPVRVAGADRVETAILASKGLFKNAVSGATCAQNQAQSVVLARSDDFADGIAGVPLARKKCGPLLLNAPGGLDSRVRAEINRILPFGGKVYLLGSTSSVSALAANTLTADGYNVTRLAGADRYQTAVKIAQNGIGNPAYIVVVDGLSYADALAAGPAGSRGGAILLTKGAELPYVTDAYMVDLANAYGGYFYGVVAGGLAAQAVATGWEFATELIGVDRYDTAAQVASFFFYPEASIPAPTNIGLTVGTDFPDGLSGGSYMSLVDGPLLITPPAVLSGYTSNALESYKGIAQTLTVFGNGVTSAVALTAAGLLSD